MTLPLFPWAVFDNVDLDVTGAECDGVELALEPDQRDLRRIDVRPDDERPAWSELRLQVSVRIPATTSGELDAESLSVVVVARCARTEMRSGVSLTRSATDATRWTGEVVVDRRFVSGAFELYAVLADGAGAAGRFRGRSGSWHIATDVSPEVGRRGDIDMVWEDFGSPEQNNPILKAMSTERFYLSLDQGRPLLYLNRGIPQLRAVLQDRIKAGAPKALQDVIAMEIATKVRLALVHAASAMVDLEQDPPGPPSEEWQRHILEDLLSDMPDVYAGRGLGLFKDMAESAETSHTVWNVVESVIERKLRAGETTAASYDKIASAVS